MKRVVKPICHFISAVLAFGAGMLSLAWANPPHPHSWDVFEADSQHMIYTGLSMGVVMFILLGANACFQYGVTTTVADVKRAGSYQFYCGEFAITCVLATSQSGSIDINLANILLLIAVVFACLGYSLPEPKGLPKNQLGAPAKKLGKPGEAKAKADTPTETMPELKKEISSWFVVVMAGVAFALALVLGGLAVLSRRQEPFTSCFGALSDIPPLTLADGASTSASLAAARDLPLGALRFSFTEDKRIVITDPQYAQAQVVYSTVAGSAFVTAAFGAFHATNDHEGGLFTIVDTPNVPSHGTVVNSVVGSANGNSVAVSGDLLFYSKPGDMSSQVEVPFTMTFDAVSAQRAQFTVAVDGVRASEIVKNKGTLRLYLNHVANEDEHFFGFGEQFDALDLKGTCVPILTSEQGVGRGLMPITFFLNLYLPGAGGSWQTTYTAVPYYLTSAMRGLFLENTEFAVFDLSHSGRVTVEVVVGAKGTIVGHVMGGAMPKDLIREYTEYAGRMRALPEWTSKGAIVGLQGGTEVVKQKVKVLQDAGVKISALWLQDWSGKRETGFGRRLFWDWQLDTDWYPNWYETMRSWAEEGIYVLTYINPHVTTAKGGKLFKIAKAMSCLVKNKDGSALVQASATPDFTFGTIDLTNPKCQDWYVQIMRRNMLNVTSVEEQTAAGDLPNGAMGWMADFAEMLPFDVELYGGSGATIHNAFPTLWAETCSKAIGVTPELARNAVFWTRSGGTQSPKHTTLQWMGDQLATFDSEDGIMSALTGILTGGISGFSLSHSDVGGYTMINKAGGLLKYVRGKEVLIRWMELSAFADAVFRTHEGNLPDHSVQVYDNVQIASVFARFSKIHSALSAYRRKLMEEAAATGMPITRAMFLHYPSDTTTYNLRTQFMLGEDMIVCPVLAPDTYHVNCYFPTESGVWKHLWTGAVASAGSNVLCSAAPGSPCVYYRAASKDAFEFLARLEDAGILEGGQGSTSDDDDDDQVSRGTGAGAIQEQGECDPTIDSECTVIE